VDRALELEPDLIEARRELGYFYYQGLLDYDLALAQFSEVAKELPNDAQLLADISFIWRRQGRMQEALANQLLAFEMNPTDASLCVEIANTYGGLRMHEKALAFSDRAIAMAPDNYWGYFLKALILFYQSGDIPGARVALEASPKQDPTAIFYLHYFLDLCENKYPAVLARLDRFPEHVIRLQSAYLPVNLLRGLAMARLGDEEHASAALISALEILEVARRASPQDPRIHGALGMTYAGLGKTQQAIEAGQRAVEIYPVTRDVMLGMDRLVNLAQIYAMVGENDQALETIRRVLSENGIYTVYHFELHPSFEKVRNEPGYQEILETFRPSSN